MVLASYLICLVVCIYIFELILPQLVMFGWNTRVRTQQINFKNMTGHLIWVVTETDYWYCVIKSESGRSNVFGF